jgi:hypothetical protein
LWGPLGGGGNGAARALLEGGENLVLSFLPPPGLFLERKMREAAKWTER